MVVAAATTGLLTLYATPVLADSSAHGATSSSSGVVSGNTAQAPVTLPVNACGNSVDVVGIVNPATGNGCATKDATKAAEPSAPAHRDDQGHEDAGGYGDREDAGGHGDEGGYGEEGGYGDDGGYGDEGEHGGGYGDTPGGYGDSPGYGDTPPDKPPVDKPPVDKPPTDKPPVDKPPVDKPPVDKPPTDKPPVDKPPVDKPPTDTPPTHRPPSLADTGSDTETLVGMSAASLGLILGGGILYRRGRAASDR